MTDARDNRETPDALRIWIPVIVLTVIGFVIAARFVGPPPPDRVRIATGTSGGGYAVAGERFAAALGEAGIEVELIPTAGSVENIDLLRRGDVDIALAQGGSADAGEPGLAGIASLYFEPVWLFAREPLTRLDQLVGLRVELGAVGSGTRILAERLLDLAGVQVVAGDADPDAAALALRDGATDAMFVVAAPRSEIVRGLLGDAPRTQVASLARYEGIARHLTFVEPIVIVAGAVDLAGEMPATDLATIGVAANLLARDGLHPAVVSLLVEAARADYGDRGVVEEHGEFPSLELLDVEPSVAARKAIEEGPSFLYRSMPFQLAAFLDRMKILLLPLLTLLFPMVRLAPPLYRWRIRRRILLWYRRVMELERQLRQGDVTDVQLDAAADELDGFDAELAGVKVPLGYADELFHLRMHLRMVRADLTERRGRWAQDNG